MQQSIKKPSGWQRFVKWCRGDNRKRQRIMPVMIDEQAREAWWICECGSAWKALEGHQEPPMGWVCPRCEEVKRLNGLLQHNTKSVRWVCEELDIELTPGWADDIIQQNNTRTKQMEALRGTTLANEVEKIADRAKKMTERLQKEFDDAVNRGAWALAIETWGELHSQMFTFLRLKAINELSIEDVPNESTFAIMEQAFKLRRRGR